MRKIIAITVLLMYTVTCFAQKDVTKFLGFPVDGSKTEMIKNLKSKDYKLSRVGDTDFLTGRFNGNDVHIYISTENGKVSRVMVCDENTMSETDIKIRFNRLCRQFQENGKYISLTDYSIPDSEDISYEMAVHNKRYEAIFYQLPEGKTMEQLQANVLKDAQSRYTPKQLETPTDETRNEIIASSSDIIIDTLRKKPVWFMISEFYGKYFISMFYDNEYNHANGEDL